MSTSILLIGLSLLAQAGTSAQAGKVDSDLANRVGQLVRQLDDHSLAARNAAEKTLVELGSEALGLLPPITPSTPAEVKERLGRIRESLEKQAAQAVIEPTRISLEGQMSVTNAFRALEEQTGNRVIGFQSRTGDVKVNLKDTIYWDALDQVLDQADLNINPFGGEPNALEVVARGKGQLPRHGVADYQGVFRIEAIRLEARRELRNPTVDTLRLTIEVAWEPRIAPIAFRQSIRQIEAVSEQGGMLYFDDRPAVLNASVAHGISAVELAIPLQLPDRGIRRIARLKGVLTALLPGRVEAFEFEDLVEARGVSKQRAGVTVVLERFHKNLDLYEARVAIRFDEAGDAFASHRGWVYGNKAFIVDAGGKRIDTVGGNPTRQRSDEVGFAYLFELPSGSDGCRFVYETPAMILQVPVEYELKDIRLP
ncbi:MAG: hypothetical protein ACC628_13140 [Pirellulaceae bacterium]